MTTEQPKPATNSEQPTTYPSTTGTFTYPPPPPGYPLFAYPPPVDGQQPDTNGAPYPIVYPPGMLYAFPPHMPPAALPALGTTVRPKRKQVKMACTNCAAACKRCDNARPCERCQKYGITDSCVDGQRKERKKGIKRGPYKRKNKQTSDSANGSDNNPQSGEGEPSSTASTPAHPLSHLPLPPEGYYSIYYPPLGAYTPPDGQPGPDGPPPNGPPPPMVPFYVGSFPPYPFPLPPPGTIFQLPPSSSHPLPLPVAQALTAEAGSAPQAEDKAEKASNQTQSAEGDLSTSTEPQSKDETGNTASRADSGDSAKI
ncbi:hypothetical protein VKT23_007422 [Stygiomarasmius scandens]|uniref:Zn(2)-C6 fungal-type domain-containing protein n=1 Tax=Marasmiellus scandens TaxID=2682957 RepID=A0ABR1JKT0_9AGAR